MGRELTDASVVGAMVTVLGRGRAMRRLGQVALLGFMYGVRDERGVINADGCGLALATRYNVVNDLKRVRAYLVAEGYRVEPDADAVGLAALGAT